MAKRGQPIKLNDPKSFEKLYPDTGLLPLKGKTTTLDALQKQKFKTLNLKAGFNNPVTAHPTAKVLPKVPSGKGSTKGPTKTREWYPKESPIKPVKVIKTTSPKVSPKKTVSPKVSPKKTPPPKGRGRPKTVEVQDKKPPGRPRKEPVEGATKRPPGRPRKVATPELPEEKVPTPSPKSTPKSTPEESKPKRRGRPPKSVTPTPEKSTEVPEKPTVVSEKIPPLTSSKNKPKKTETKVVYKPTLRRAQKTPTKTPKVRTPQTGIIALPSTNTLVTAPTKVVRRPQAITTNPELAQAQETEHAQLLNVLKSLDVTRLIPGRIKTKKGSKPAYSLKELAVFAKDLGIPPSSKSKQYLIDAILQKRELFYGKI